MESFRRTLGSDTFAQNFTNNGTLLRIYFTGVLSSPLTDIPGSSPTLSNFPSTTSTTSSSGAPKHTSATATTPPPSLSI
ncbi:hypothetical protein MMC14_001622 [Varicellaria rhodocarpa]|nr:hypothetical protein [Varicellaria rhodocarpa]